MLTVGAWIALGLALILFGIASIRFMRTEKRYGWVRSVFDSIHKPLLILDHNGQVRHHNEAAANLIDKPQKTSLPTFISSLLPPKLGAAILENINNKNVPVTQEILIDNRLFHYSISPLNFFTGNWYLIEIEDRTNIKDLTQKTSFYERLLVRVRNLIIVTDAQEKTEWINPAFEYRTGYTLGEIKGKKPGTLLQGPETDPETVREIHEHLQHREPFKTQILNYTKHGEAYWVDMLIEPFRLIDGRPGFVSVENEITAEKKLENRIKKLDHLLKIKDSMIKQMTHIDGLTQLGNINLFTETMIREWGRAVRKGIPLTLILFDIDQFHSWNLLLGYQKADQILKEIALILQKHIRRTTDLNARYGGDQFVSILPDTTAENGALLAKRIQEEINALNFHHEAIETEHVCVSIGIACHVPSREDHHVTLLEKVEQQLRTAKMKGPNTISVENGNCPEA
jgi:diguanylate cyclase (GGDEF)-like protein/PAS domain S-box-containing protein